MWLNSAGLVTGRRRRWHPTPVLLPGKSHGRRWAAVHGVAKSRKWLNDFTFTFHFHALEKEMTTHSSVLAWRISGMEELGRLLSMGSHRVGHDWSDLAAAAAHLLYLFKIVLCALITQLYVTCIAQFVVFQPEISSYFNLWTHDLLGVVATLLGKTCLVISKGQILPCPS